MAIGVIAPESGIGVPVDRPIALHLEGRRTSLVVILSILVLDRGGIAGAVGASESCADSKGSRGQRDSHNHISHGAYPLVLAVVRRSRTRDKSLPIPG